MCLHALAVLRQHLHRVAMTTQHYCTTSPNTRLWDTTGLHWGSVFAPEGSIVMHMTTPKCCHLVSEGSIVMHVTTPKCCHLVSSNRLFHQHVSSSLLCDSVKHDTPLEWFNVHAFIFPCRVIVLHAFVFTWTVSHMHSFSGLLMHTCRDYVLYSVIHAAVVVFLLDIHLYIYAFMQSL